MQEILRKLQQFKTKYYVGKLISGSLIVLLWSMLAMLLFALLEYTFRLSSTGRMFLALSFLVLCSALALKYIARPAYEWIFSKGITSRDSAQLIGQHFSEVSDKLYNLLDLHALLKKHGPSDILKASIDQKIEQLQWVPFSQAIDFKQHAKYSRWLLIPVSIVLLAQLTNRLHVFTEGSQRILRYSEVFIPPAPFAFEIEDTAPKTRRGQSYVARVRLVGDDFPDRLFIEVEGQPFPMEKVKNEMYEFTFEQPREHLNFQFVAGVHRSEKVTLSVLPYPEIEGMSVTIVPPSYTKASQRIEHIGDVEVLEGSQVIWKWATLAADSLMFQSEDTLLKFSASQGNEVLHSATVFHTQPYTLSASNVHFLRGEEYAYTITVIPDEAPRLEIEEIIGVDSTAQQLFSGIISDDYGFHSLEMVLESGDSIWRRTLPRSGGVTVQKFHAFLDIDSLKLDPGSELKYFIEVRDNNALKGFQKTRSKTFYWKQKTQEEWSQETEALSRRTQEELKEQLQNTKALKKEIEELINTLVQKPKADWKDKKRLEELLQKQQSIQAKIAELQKAKQDLQKNNPTKSAQETSPEEQAMEQLLEELNDPEMQNLLEEIAELLEKVNKKKLQESLEKFQEQNEMQNHDLERSLELLKALKVEEAMQESIAKLDSIRNKQEELAEETQASEGSAEKQDSLNAAFEELQKALSEMFKENQELERPYQSMESTENEQKAIEESMKESSKDLQENNEQSGAEKQKESAEKMEELQESLAQMMQGMQNESAGEDMDQLAQILEDLVDLSFEEEALLVEIQSMHPRNPSFSSTLRKQQEILQKSKGISDSLLALSKRQIAIEKTVTREVQRLEKELKTSLEKMGDLRMKPALVASRYAMTSANNLALLLSDILDQMQQQSNPNPMQGQGSCSKPGGKGKGKGEGKGGGPSMGDLKKMQESVGQGMKSLQQDLLNEGKGAKGSSSGEGGESGEGTSQKGKENGNKAGERLLGKPGEAERLVKLQAQQEAIRRALKEIQEGMQSDDGKNTLKRTLEEMKRIEKDILLKQITPETIERQNKVIDQMLKAEEAEKEKEKEQKREAQQGRKKAMESSDVWKKWKQKERSQLEKIEIPQLPLKPFFKESNEEYLQSL